MWPRGPLPRLAATPLLSGDPEAWRAKRWRPGGPRPRPHPPALTCQHLEATASHAASLLHRVVNDNSQTTDLIFCKKEKIIGHFHVGGGALTLTLAHTQWKLSLSPSQEPNPERERERLKSVYPELPGVQSSVFTCGERPKFPDPSCASMAGLAGLPCRRQCL